MKNTTLLFLIKKDHETITDICLAMKKRGFGAGRWNGTGGKLEAGETIEDAVVRETQEEISVIPQGIKKIAELTFIFPHQPDWAQLCHVYFCTEWVGNPTESEEMKPEWFSVDSIPYNTMWPDDILWLPLALDHKSLKAQFSFGEGDIILNQEITIVDSF